MCYWLFWKILRETSIIPFSNHQSWVSPTGARPGRLGRGPAWRRGRALRAARSIKWGERQGAHAFERVYLQAEGPPSTTPIMVAPPGIGRPAQPSLSVFSCVWSRPWVVLDDSL
nr:uncharacterized protein LOC109729958 isoform X2 [Microcebus murinus]